jgi:hypothetical protein
MNIYNWYFVLIGSLAFIPLQGEPKQVSPKTTYERCVLFAKGIGMSCVGLSPLIGVGYWMRETYKKLPITPEEMEKQLKQDLSLPETEELLVKPRKNSRANALNPDKKPPLCFALGCQGAFAAGILYTNYKYIWPRALNYFKQAFS